MINQHQYIIYKIKEYKNKGCTASEAVEFAFYDAKNKFGILDLTLLEDTELLSYLKDKGEEVQFYLDKNDIRFAKLSHILTDKII